MIVNPITVQREKEKDREKRVYCIAYRQKIEHK
jgi:hypothetical protein